MEESAAPPPNPPCSSVSTCRDSQHSINAAHTDSQSFAEQVRLPQVAVSRSSRVTSSTSDSANQGSLTRSRANSSVHNEDPQSGFPPLLTGGGRARTEQEERLQQMMNQMPEGQFMPLSQARVQLPVIRLI